jgi:hypothetical protein
VSSRLQLFSSASSQWPTLNACAGRGGLPISGWSLVRPALSTIRRWGVSYSESCPHGIRKRTHARCGSMRTPESMIGIRGEPLLVGWEAGLAVAQDV